MAQSGDQLNENMSKDLMRAIQNKKHHNKKHARGICYISEDSRSTKKEGTELDLENSEYRKQNGDYEARMFLRRIYDRAEF